MTALPPLATGEAPAGFPQSSRQGFNLSQASARALSAPVLVTDIGDGAFLVEPLAFYPIAYPNGDAVVSKSYFSHYS